MAFRDQMLVCESCGKSFVFTVTEQRRLAEETGQLEVDSPALCAACRQGSVSADVREEPAPPASVVREMPEPASGRQRERPAVPEPVVPEPAAPPPSFSPEDELDVAIEDEFPLEEDGIQVMLIGTVKWFSLGKGYGFVTKADGQDLFFHRSDVVGRQSTQIEEGQQVEFQIRRTDKGLEAFNVSILPPA